MKKNLVFPLILAVSVPALVNAEGLLMYKPPQTGAPVKRIGGGTRGLGVSISQIQVLAPAETALTSKSQPVLYWYLSESKQKAYEITVEKEGTDEPVLRKQIHPVAKAGLQKIRLSEYGVFLQEGVDYRWSVAVINDTENSLGENIASAALRFQTPATPLSSAEQQAQAGYWYDALQKLIEARSPLANELLKQIGVDLPAL